MSFRGDLATWFPIQVEDAQVVTVPISSMRIAEVVLQVSLQAELRRQGKYRVFIAQLDLKPIIKL